MFIERIYGCFDELLLKKSSRIHCAGTNFSWKMSQYVVICRKNGFNVRIPGSFLRKKQFFLRTIDITKLVVNIPASLVAHQYYPSILPGQGPFYWLSDYDDEISLVNPYNNSTMCVKPIFLLNTPQVSPKCTCADDVYLHLDFWQKVIWFGSTQSGYTMLHIPRRTQG